MDLTAGPVVAGIVLLAVAAVVAVPWTWDRWRSPRPARSALVLLATTGVLLATGAVVNRQAGFFPTVASLVSGQGAAVTVGQDGVLAALPVSAAAPDLSLVQARRLPGQGAVVRVQLTGARTGLSRAGAVYLPAAYFDPAQAQVRFPVVEVLSGSPGSPAQTLHLLHLAETLDTSIAEHRAAPMVVVVPDTNGSAVRDRECVDAAGGGTPDETYLTADVQTFVGQRFRVQAPGRGWALLGTSTGGYCAVNLALRHPEEYAGSTVEVALARLHRQPSIPPTLPAGWPGLLTAMTSRAPAARPTPGEAARELARIAAGGEATTVLRAAAVPVVERTSVLPRTRVAPVQTRAETPLPPRRAVPAAPRRSPWPVVLLLLAILAAGVGGVLYAQSQGGTNGPLPAVSPDLPPELRDPLQRLKDSVDS